ncbi:MAG: Fe-S-containing protein [Nitrospiraceae bacterium]|nr:Fe-S-containing protein [Nitrospiraceae bacterium]
MSVCSKCGGEMREDAKFCKACGSGTAGAEEKKARVLAGEQKGKSTWLIAGVVALLILTGVAVMAMNKKSMSGMMKVQAVRDGAPETSYAPITAENGEVRIALDTLQGSKANYYIYKDGDKTIKFFVLKASDGTVRAALDACQACYHAKLGYRQNGETMVCNNCGMGFKSTDVGIVTGGCSPIPVEKKTDGKMLIVKASDLVSGAKYF